MPGDHQVFKTGQFSKSVNHFCDNVREYASFRAIWRKTRVPTVREKSGKNEKKIKVREKSGNF